MLAAIVFTAATMFCGLLLAGRLAMRSRLRLLASLGTINEDPQTGEIAAARQRPTHAVALRQAFRRTGATLSLGPLRRWAERTLRGSGLPLRAEELLALCLAGVVLGWALGAALGLPGFVRVLLVGAGPVAPVMWARRARAKRTAAISTQLGDVLMTLGNGLRAGHSLFQALEAAARQSVPPLGDELRRMLRETTAGIPVDEALQHLNERAANDDLELLVTAILVQRQVGGNLAEILDKISATIRARVQVQNHLRVITAQSRLSGWVVSLLPVGVYGITTLIAPQVEHTLTSDPIGRMVAAAAVVMEVFGILAIRKVVSIRY